MLSQIVSSPIGPLKLTVKDCFIIGLEFFKEQNKFYYVDSTKNINLNDSNDIRTLKQAKHELEKYFAGQLRQFTVPVKFSGPPFYQKVWRLLQDIDYGETKTYKELAKSAGSPKAARAVGSACAANPIVIIVPCHRVLAQSSLGGFGGGLATKRWLLELESKTN